ncbi:hypothetical protein SRM_01839 [Salinibacter ruber M8]|uniref:Uncharacterized protein n=1 Tax=Salinibacter ruber (strain M8) TaxID=761659 RepID=D5H9Q5_SALRM|nr:hypothetical protein SRM_01839 [Salinibacter ruber M8]
MSFDYQHVRPPMCSGAKHFPLAECIDEASRNDHPKNVEGPCVAPHCAGEGGVRTCTISQQICRRGASIYCSPPASWGNE